MEHEHRTGHLGPLPNQLVNCPRHADNKLAARDVFKLAGIAVVRDSHGTAMVKQS